MMWRANTSDSGHATSNLTVITAATLSRLDALESQCKSYPGPISAAIYIPLITHNNSLSMDLTQAHQADLLLASNKLAATFEGSEKDPHGCHYHALMLVTEMVTDASMAALLPINALRNIALIAASTPLVAMIDVDLLVSTSLADSLNLHSQHPLSYSIILKASQGSTLQPPVAWILPAYETSKLLDLKEGIELVEDAVRGPKAELGGLIAGGKIQSFASVFYPKGHACTDFKKWFNASDSIQATYTVNCEPWFIIHRLLCPLYDTRFRGYGWNKVQQVAHVNSSGFRFILHPTAFLIHRPHAKSDAQGMYSSVTLSKASSQETKTVSRGKLFHRKVASLRHRALRDMKRGTYGPILDPGTSNCIASLPWWASYSKASKD
jgi:hypothetical protein